MAESVLVVTTKPACPLQVIWLTIVSWASLESVLEDVAPFQTQANTTSIPCTARKDEFDNS